MLERAQKPTIGLVVDRYDWALANVARQLTTHLAGEYSFDVLWGYGCEPETLLYMSRHYAAVHFLWRDILTQVGREWRQGPIERAFGSWDRFARECLQARPVTFTVFDHLFLDPDSLVYAKRLFGDLSTAYTVSSWKLESLYKAIPGYRAPAMVTPDGVDCKLFRPRNRRRFSEVGQYRLRVGWVGNSAWGNDRLEQDSKGLNTILRPALQSLVSEGAKIEERFADSEIRFIPHQKMSQYYSTIDVLVCSSLIEGTPNPVLEAMACGVPVVSTDVGIVREAFGQAQQDFILPSRSVSDLKAALGRLLLDPARLGKLSEENLRSIVSWDWSLQARRYGDFFRKAILDQQAKGFIVPTSPLRRSEEIDPDPNEARAHVAPPGKPPGRSRSDAGSQPRPTERSTRRGETR